MKALVVDPSRTFQRILASAIESGGIDTVQVSTGGEALQLLKQQSFDLIFVAMHLLDMDGPMFSSHLRANARTRQTPLIMITSNKDKRTFNHAFLKGVTEVFPKHELQKITDFIVQFYMSGNGNKMSGDILYIEDNPSTSAITTTALKDSGFMVDHFTTGELGMEAFKKNTYDLVLIDILLEGKMSGYRIIRTIRGFKDERNKIPILALSSFDDDAKKVKLLRSGASDYVAKPMLHEELISRVNNLITNKKLTDKTVALQRRMHELAMKDQLTGLYNRHFLMETAPSKLSEAMRHKIPCCLVMVDADNFKLINDNYGHATGDIVLKEIATVLLKSSRTEDLVARFDGEEFVLLLSHCNMSDALAKAEDIRRTLEELCPAGLKITASFGVAEMQQNSDVDFTALFRAADEAVYKAKMTGQNKIIAHQYVHQTESALQPN